VFYPRFRPSAFGVSHACRTVVRNFLIETLAMQSHDRRWIALRQDQVWCLLASKWNMTVKRIYRSWFWRKCDALFPPVDSLSVVDSAFTSLCQSHRRLAHQSDFQTGMKLILDLCLCIGLPCILPPSSRWPAGDWPSHGAGGIHWNSSFILCCFGLQKNCYCPRNEWALSDAVNQRLGALNYPPWILLVRFAATQWNLSF